MPGLQQTSLRPKSIQELQQYLLTHPPDLALFRLRGPFAVDVHEDRELRISATERIETDLYLSASAEKAPLVIFLHGYETSKRAHAYQAMHVASWGMHSLSVQLSKHGPWIGNGRTLARIVNLIQSSPALVDRRIDPDRIVLVGHSFGGASVAVALAEGARAAGGVLLDPAAVGRDLPTYLRRIAKPVIVIGADDELSAARNRDYFYRYIRSVMEVSVRDAVHEDAQYPSEYSLEHFGRDPYTTEESQVAFASAATAAAFSVSATGTFDYAWASFTPALENGTFFNAKKK